MEVREAQRVSSMCNTTTTWRHFTLWTSNPNNDIIPQRNVFIFTMRSFHILIKLHSSRLEYKNKVKVKPEKKEIDELASYGSPERQIKKQKRILVSDSHVV